MVASRGPRAGAQKQVSARILTNPATYLSVNETDRPSKILGPRNVAFRSTNAFFRGASTIDDGEEGIAYRTDVRIQNQSASPPNSNKRKNGSPARPSNIASLIFVESATESLA